MKNAKQYLTDMMNEPGCSDEKKWFIYQLADCVNSKTVMDHDQVAFVRKAIDTEVPGLFERFKPSRGSEREALRGISILATLINSFK